MVVTAFIWFAEAYVKNIVLKFKVVKLSPTVGEEDQPKRLSDNRLY
jgi:hypothetical protein